MRGENSRIRRLIRLYRFDRNPLRRRWDRLESLLLAAVLLLFAACAVPAVALGSSVYAGGLSAELNGRWVTARLVTDAPGMTKVSPEGPGVTTATMVRWIGPDGKWRSGTAPVPPGAKAGSTVRVWTDPDGNLTLAPPDRLETTTRAIVVGVGVQLLGGGVLLGAYALAHRALERRRDAAWDAAWAALDRRRHRHSG